MVIDVIAATKEPEMIKAGQTTEVQVDDGFELTIRRPDGTVETKLAEIPGFRACNPQLFARIKAATKAAGKGEVLSYRNLTKAAVYIYTVADEINAGESRVQRAMHA
jgi:hypothetical protein